MPAIRSLAGALASLAALAHAATIAVVGEGPGNIQTRTEIRDLEANADQWNLYMLTMADFKSMDQSDPLGFYGVATVHGVPNEPYDGVTSAAGPDGYAVGYCTHTSAMFPAWHRAYTTLFEQQFLARVNGIVSQFQGADQARYASAASTLRIPYWDWAMVPPSGQPSLPASITNPQVTVNTPTGQQTIANPLYNYEMNPLNTTGFIWSPWDSWNSTLRYPNSNSPSATSSEQDAINTMNGDNSNLRSRMYNLFSTCSDYRGFGNSDQAGAQYCSDSLESIHNNVHNDMGGLGSQNVAAGHMTILPMAAFDPVFWLHHINVDRFFALWQGINPNSYDMSANQSQPTYSIPAGTHVDANSFLAPFHSNANGGEHTTNTVRDWTQFGYNYPEFVGGDTSADGIRAKFNKLYNPSATAAPAPSATSSAVSSSAPSSSPTAPSAPAPSATQAQDLSKDISQAFQKGGQALSGFLKGLPAFGAPQNGQSNDQHKAGSLPGFGGAQNGHSGFGGGFRHRHRGLQPLGSVVSKAMSTAVPSGLHLANATGAMLNSTGSAVHSLSDKLHNMTSQMLNSTTLEYTTQIACQPYALRGSYNIYMFTSAPKSDNPRDWFQDENMCGTFSSFGSPGMQTTTVQVGSVPLTSHLSGMFQSGGIKGLTREIVVPFLKQQLQWRVVNMNGEIVPNEQVPGLQIGVSSARFQPSNSSSQFPKMVGGWMQHTEVTQGKSGGLQKGQNSPFAALSQVSAVASSSNSYSSAASQSSYSYSSASSQSSYSYSSAASHSASAYSVANAPPAATSAVATAGAAAPSSSGSPAAPAAANGTYASTPTESAFKYAYTGGAAANGVSAAVVAGMAGVAAFLLL